MSVKDVNPKKRVKVSPVEGMRTIIDARDTMMPDHLVDALARGYALEVLSGIDITEPVTRSISTHLTKVTYG